MSTSRAVHAAFTAVVIAGCGFFVATNAPAIADAALSVHRLSVGAVAVGVLLSVVAILNRGGKARASHRAVGLNVPSWSMVRPTMAGFTADKVVRAGGLSGMAVMLRHGARSGYAHGAVWASTVVVKVASFISLGLFLMASVVVLAVSGQLTRWWLAAAIGFSMYAAVVGGVIAVVSRHRKGAEKCWSWISGRLPRLSRWLGGEDPVEAVANGLRAARANRALLRQVAGHAVAAKALGAAMLLVATHAAGVPLGVGSVLVVYSTVLLASFASMTPGGLGVVEASGTALLIGVGLGTTEAILVVALFRVLDLWIPMVLGALALWISATPDDTSPADDALVPGPRPELAVPR